MIAVVWNFVWRMPRYTKSVCIGQKYECWTGNTSFPVASNYVNKNYNIWHIWLSVTEVYTDLMQLRFNLRFDTIILSLIESNPKCSWPISKWNWIKDVPSVNRILTNPTKMLWIQMNQDFQCSVSFTQYAVFASIRPQNPDIHILFQNHNVLSKWGDRLLHFRTCIILFR